MIFYKVVLYDNFLTARVSDIIYLSVSVDNSASYIFVFKWSKFISAIISYEFYLSIAACSYTSLRVWLNLSIF